MAENALVIPGITDAVTLACIARSRTFNQYCMMVLDALANRCSFCDLDPKRNVILLEDNSWRAWQNPSPESHTRHHFIIAPKRHITDTEKLSADEKLDLFLVMGNLRARHGYKSRGILIRDGDATLSAGTVEHLHIHVMVPDGTGRVESPFYKGEAAERESLARAIVFEKMRQGATIGKLSTEEYALVTGREH